MWRHSLALFWSRQQQKPQPQLGFLPFVGCRAPEIWILNASLVKFWILAKTAFYILSYKASPPFPCGRTRSINPPQILTKSNHHLFVINGLRFLHRHIGVIKSPQNDRKMYFCEILNSPQEPSHGAGWIVDFHQSISAKNATFLARRWGGRSADSVGDKIFPVSRKEYM